MSPQNGASAGPLAGLRVLELCDEKGAFAGKLLADMGAEVIKVEPPAGDPSRGYAPFAGDRSDAERSLWWWHYNTSKRGVTLDLQQEAGRDLLRRMVARADVVIESGPPNWLAALGLDYDDLKGESPRLIWVSLTPFGRNMPRAEEQATDLTLLAGGGPVWNTGYDDHALPPVRGGGNQGFQTGCHFAVMSLLAALLNRDRTGRGQLIDVNMHAAANVTTEAGSYTWLVARETVQRQTGRHASVRPSMPSQILCADGRYAMGGIPPRTPEQFRRVYEWLEQVGLLDRFEQAEVLKLGAEGEPISLATIADDELARAKFAAGRDALSFLAEHLSAYDFFVGGQDRNIQIGVIYAPEETLEDRHFAARGFPVEVEHPEDGRGYRYPGAPYRFEKTPWQIARRAPLLGEDNAAVYAELGLDAAELEKLRASGAI